jgi:hypothetical protein
MTISDTIEQFFSSAQEVIIDVTPDYKKGPSAIALVCTDPTSAAKGYFLLHETYKDRKITILLHQNIDTLDIYFVIKDTADTINIKNLKYDKNEFDNFLKSGTTDQRIALILSTGKMPSGAISMLSIPQMLSPIVLDKYSIV